MLSLADPFGLSPAINWRGAGHTILGLLGFLTFVPGCQAIGIAANAINAIWYFSEGNIFEGLCSTVGVFGGGYLMLGKAGTASCGVMNFFKYTTATLSIVVGVSDMHTIAKKNYDAALHGEGLTLKSFINDTVRVVFDSTSIAGGIKLATEQIPKTSNSDLSMDYRKDTREYLSEGGGRIATTKEVRAYKKSWNQRGIKVVTDMKERKLEPGAAAGFDYKSVEIIIRKKPSLLSLYHEGFHAQQFLEIGKEEYMAISSLAREEYVYNQLVSSGLCNEAELLNAKAYIERLRFMG